MTLNNLEIRQAIENRRLKYFEVARQLNINPATFSRWLQNEVDPKRKKEILEAIKAIKL